MVRLKDKWITADLADTGVFQFHYGTIKRLLQVIQYVLRLYFNSTMVRLKADIGKNSNSPSDISIPLWYD